MKLSFSLGRSSLIIQGDQQNGIMDVSTIMNLTIRMPPMDWVIISELNDAFGNGNDCILIQKQGTILLMEDIPNNHLGCINPCK